MGNDESFDVWKTLFHTDGFDYNKYLYHYTKFESALKILDSEGLRFSTITNTNDPAESKMRIVFDGLIMTDDTKAQFVVKKFEEYRNNFHLLCFSMDSKLTDDDIALARDTHSNYDYDKFYDVTGRGFASPRMWAQYAENNEGVCFVIKKNELEQQLKCLVQQYNGKVEYKQFLEAHHMTAEEMSSLYNQLMEPNNGDAPFIRKIQDDVKFRNYNFFCKLKDWENEREYRYIFNKNQPTNEKVIGKHLFSYLKGIVIGEKMPSAFEASLRALLHSKYKNKENNKTVRKREYLEIKRISFSDRYCKIVDSTCQT